MKILLVLLLSSWMGWSLAVPVVRRVRREPGNSGLLGSLVSLRENNPPKDFVYQLPTNSLTPDTGFGAVVPGPGGAVAGPGGFGAFGGPPYYGYNPYYFGGSPYLYPGYNGGAGAGGFPTGPGGPATVFPSNAVGPGYDIDSSLGVHEPRRYHIIGLVTG